ncbi:MAG: ABC transporter ATP-binding protein [Candidatus Hydrogenedens sp.]|nr:ABC transporter ATP-binding protein [Candidatus Hydrogenedentota bacterium]NLF56063.1 ABC transporter ATP-binding protein [Candidatus Hydrogenedens sp.]
MTAAAFEVKNVGLVLDGKAILRDISFSVAPGESLAIIGPNGAGKTSLLRGLMRMTPGVTGTVRVFGDPVARLSQRELARRVSYVPQAEGRTLPFTVREFLLMARYPHMNPFSHLTPTDYAAVDRAAERCGVAGFSGRGMDTLSGGERQKVFIAAALAQAPRAVLLDEPTTFLDYRHQVEVLELVDQLHREEGLTVLSVTHDLNQGALAGDRILALKDGRTAFHGTPAELLANPGLLGDIYGTGFDFLTHPHTGAVIVAPVKAAP